MTRREFLRGSLAATGLTIAVSATPLGYRLLNAAEMKKDELANLDSIAWFKITPDNMVTIYSGASEMGQGTHTAHAMIIADELEADWSRVKVVQGESRKEFINELLHGQITVASSSVRVFYQPLREMGAAARAVLVKAAASTKRVSSDIWANSCPAWISRRKSAERLFMGSM
jgi:isoquinoline 1-oxidoreductase beta subunit